MKLLVILFVVVIVIALVGALWLRTMRQGPDTVESRDPHRLDDSVSPGPTPVPGRADPTVASNSLFGGGTEPAPEGLGSDLVQEPEITGGEGTPPDADPQSPGARPGA